jgi:hypothetical protein
MGNIKRVFVLFIVLSPLFFFGCAPMVKTDLKSLLADPEKYKGSEVIVTSDIKSVLGDKKAYLGRKVELKGYVEFYGLRRLDPWHFILKDEEGNAVTCYEWEYRVRSWTIPEVTLRQAQKQHQEVTVVGRVESSRIELDWIEYQGQIIDTDYKPPYIIVGGMIPRFNKTAFMR